jgi:hypothetical protein
LPQLDSTVLKTYGNQIISGDFIFEDNVYFSRDLDLVNRRINNIHLVNDLMIRGRNNVLTVPKVFVEDINVENNLDITYGKTIGDIDISEMVKNAVIKSDRKYNIYGHKHFHSLEVDHLRVGLINGLEISSKNLLLNYGNQQILGVKQINNHLTVNSQITANQINGISIPHLSQRLVLKGVNNTIDSMKTFNSHPTVHNVHAFGRVDGVDVNELNYFVGILIDLLGLRTQLQRQDQKIALFHRALEHQAIDLAYYEMVSSLRSGPALLAYHNSKTKSQHLFISGQHLSNGCQEIEVYEQSINVFKSIAKLYAIDANSIISYTYFGNRFVLISNSRKGPIPECLKQNVSPHLLNYESGPSIIHVFQLNEKQNIYEQKAFIRTETVFDQRFVKEVIEYPFCMQCLKTNC